MFIWPSKLTQPEKYLFPKTVRISKKDDQRKVTIVNDILARYRVVFEIITRRSNIFFKREREMFYFISYRFRLFILVSALH